MEPLEFILRNIPECQVAFAQWLSLRSVTTALRDMFRTSIVPAFIRHLQSSLAADLGPISKYIHCNSHVVTGGYLLGQIQGTVCADSDVDICVKSDTSVLHYDDAEWDTRIVDFDNLDFSLFCDAYRVNGWRTGGECGSYKVIKAGYFTSRKLTSPVDGSDIDHIIITGPMTINEHIDSFDFQFCKVAFDGKKLTIFDMDAVITRTTVITDALLDHMVEFYKIYKITWSHPYVQRKEDVVPRIIKRIAKYIDRGYTILYQDDNDVQILDSAALPVLTYLQARY